MRRRRLLLLLGTLALAVMLVRHPTANIRIITHDMTDPAPHKIEAAIDMGLFALSLLVTWTAKGMAVR
jgi:hypothetical protein